MPVAWAMGLIYANDRLLQVVIGCNFRTISSMNRTIISPQGYCLRHHGRIVCAHDPTRLPPRLLRQTRRDTRNRKATWRLLSGPCRCLQWMARHHASHGYSDAQGRSEHRQEPYRMDQANAAKDGGRSSRARIAQCAGNRIVTDPARFPVIPFPSPDERLLLASRKRPTTPPRGTAPLRDE